MNGEKINGSNGEQDNSDSGVESLQNMKSFEKHIQEIDQKAESERVGITKIEDALTHTGVEWKSEFNKTALKEARNNHEAAQVDIGALREMIIESGDFFKDNREYTLGEECTSCDFADGSLGAMLPGRIEVGDVIKTSGPLPRRLGGGWGIESHTVSEAEHGFYMVATGADGNTEEIGFFSDGDIEKEFSVGENGKYSRETLFKGVQNNTGIEFCGMSYTNMRKYKDDATLSEKNSKEQIILVPCDSTKPDGSAHFNRMFIGSTSDFLKQE